MYDFQSPVCWSNSPNVPWVAIYLVGTVNRALVSLAPQRVHNVGRTRIMAMHTNIYTTKNAKSTCTITQLSITLRKALQKSITHAYTKHTVMLHYGRTSKEGTTLIKGLNACSLFILPVRFLFRLWVRVCLLLRSSGNCSSSL